VSKGKAREESQRIDARSDGGETDERTQERSRAPRQKGKERGKAGGGGGEEGGRGGKLDEAWFSKRRLFFPGHWAVQSFRKSRLLRNYAGVGLPIRRSDDALVFRAGRKRGTKPATDGNSRPCTASGEDRSATIAIAGRSGARRRRSASIQRRSVVIPLSLPFGGPVPALVD